MEDSTLQNLIIYRASRLEALLDPLLSLMDQFLPADVLAPQTLIAANPGIKKWLSGALARKRGPGGIVANVDIQLPSAWLDESTTYYLGKSAVGLQEFRNERLRWWIHALLPEIDDAGIAASLQGANAPLRKFQLADRLAHVFGQYIMYRPDWLSDWRAGRNAARDAGFQPELWRRLQKEIAAPNRAELLEQLIAHLNSGSAQVPKDPVFVFGVIHLAPAELRLLAAMSAHRPVVLFVPDPSAKYWADDTGAQKRETRFIGLPGSAEHRLRLASGEVFESASESLFLEEVGHPLLANWGRMGQHFMLALEATQVSMDVRHWEDEVALSDDEPHTLLARVQASIRELDPGLPLRVPATPAEKDASLRIHACHTPLRELEVLRDALLAARSKMPDLKPSEIAVFAPNMGTYVPLLASVFGPANDAKAELPYHLASVSIARTHPIFTAFAKLLALPQSRISAPEVVDLIRIPEVAAAFGIGPDGVETLTRWLQRTGIAWGLDGAFKARAFEVPADTETTFAWGVERLMAGYVFGQEPAGRAVARPGLQEDASQKIWPVEGIEGPQVRLLGALDALLSDLAAMHAEATIRRSASAWSDLLLAFTEGFFRINPRDRDARSALSTLRGMIGALKTDTAGAGDPELDFEVVREVLLAQLSSASERQHLLMGGVTFAGMVAARSLPFRVIAVLGLNENDFPRQASDGGLDLTLKSGNRRIGDRDVRSDDRFLFLETVMAARAQLHLSYIGEGVNDGKPRNPAMPLAELMAFLDRGTPSEGKSFDKRELRPWYFRHPLQPFDASYFSADSRFGSFNATLAATRIGIASEPSFMGSRVALNGEEKTQVSLQSVISWFKDPAKQVLNSALQLRLDALEKDQLSEQEPLDSKLSALDRVPRRLALDALLGQDIPTDPPDWLRLGGKLPAGRFGRAAWSGEGLSKKDSGAYSLATELFDSRPENIRAHTLKRVRQTIAWEGQSASVFGEVADVLVAGKDNTQWVFDAFPKKAPELVFKQLIPLFLNWALLRLQIPDDIEVRVCLLLLIDEKKPAESRTWSDNFDNWCNRFQAADPAAKKAMRQALEARVEQILAPFLAAQRETVWYFPKTSWQSRLGKYTAESASDWAGDDNKTGERDYSPGYAAVFARGVDLGRQATEGEGSSEEAIQAELARIARTLAEAIRLDPPILMDETEAGEVARTP